MAHLVDGTVGNQPAQIHDGDAVTQALDQLHDVTREHDRVAAVGEAFEHAANGAGRHGIDRFERLVEEEDARAVQQGGGQGDLLAHPVAVVDHQRAGRLGQAEHIQQLFGATGDHGRVHAPQQPVVGQQLGAGEALEQGQVLGQHADHGLGLHRDLPHVELVDVDLAGVGPQQAGHHLERRRLARPVGAHQAEEAPAGNHQVDAGHRYLGPERLGQPADGEGGARHIGQRIASRVPTSTILSVGCANFERVFVLGIDPGVSRCGYGCVTGDSRAMRAVSAGVITTPKDDPLPERLAALAAELRALVEELQPDAMAVERVFFQTNARTAMSVGQASGLALVVATEAGCPVAQYTPNEVKMAVTGYGAAPKAQVQQMVQSLLGLPERPRPPDTADALALAICHLSLAPAGPGGGSEVPMILETR